MAVTVNIPSLGDKFKDYRDEINGNSYTWGPVINAIKINGFVFHHSVTKQTAKVDGNWKKEVDIIANLHLSQGWEGIAYRFVIASSGHVLYVGDLSHGGSAVANNNDHLFSACFIGDFTKELPTASQVHSAHVLAKFFLTQMPQYPNLKSWDQVKGHKNFNATQCPGTNWESVSDSLRNRIVNDVFQGYPDPQPVSTPSEPPTTDYKKKYEETQVKLDFTVQKLAETFKQTVVLQEKIDRARTKTDEVKKELA